jgi:hypothetical protein
MISELYFVAANAANIHAGKDHRMVVEVFYENDPQPPK